MTVSSDPIGPQRPPEAQPEMNANKRAETDEPSSFQFTRRSPHDTANCVARHFFTYLLPTFWRGWRQNRLQMADLFRCPAEEDATRVAPPLYANWDANRKRKHPRSFGCVMFRTFARGYLTPVMLYLVLECGLKILQSLALGQVVQYFTQGHVTSAAKPDESTDTTTAKPPPIITLEWAWLCAGAVCTTALVCNSLTHPLFMAVMRLGMRCRTATCALLYRKSLRLSLAATSGSDSAPASVGQLVNLMSNDATRFDEFSIFACYIVIAPIQCVLIIALVWTYLGVACFVGLGILLLFIPFQLCMGKWFARVRASIAALTDSRLRYMTEIIAGMRVIKMYAWERPFAEQVGRARKAEVGQVRRACYLRGLNLSIAFVASRVVLFAMFVTYVLLGNRLTADGVFVTLALFNTLRITLTFMFPNAISLLGELRISCRRIEALLLLPELKNSEEDSGGEKILTVDLGTPYIQAHRIHARWDVNSDRCTLGLTTADIDLRPGDLLAVIGPVGAGKSSLLMALLRELPLLSGYLHRSGSVAYASQDAWSFNDTVRNNILFGAEYNSRRYRRVVEVCALERDFRLMAAGDQTLVGERSAALSGGQKARINLARAVYRDADIVLLDDPLSAVDAAVAEHIFNRCILGHLRSKIRVLVTHQIQFIQKATKVLVLDESGHSAGYGTYQELIDNPNIDFMSLLRNAPETVSKQSSDAVSSAIRRQSSFRASVRSTRSDAGRPRTLSIGPVTMIEPVIDVIDELESAEPNTALEEEESSGSLSWTIYRQYASAGGGPLLWIAMVVLSLVSQVSFHWADIFLTEWTAANEAHAQTRAERDYDIYFFSGLIAVLFVTTIARSVTFFSICMNASVRLHRSAFGRLLRAPVRFFDTNPSGRILNRFTKDLGIVDEALPKTAYDLNLISCQAIGLVATISLVNHYLAFPALILAIVIYLVRSVYIRSARDIKRAEARVRSPVYCHVATTTSGLATVRAYRAQHRLQTHFLTTLNDHSATWFWYLASARAMGQLLDWITLLYIVTVTGCVMTLGVSGNGTGSGSATTSGGAAAGLAITSALMLAGMTQWGVIQSTEFESLMTSVERILAYRRLEQERRSAGDQKPPTSGWPAAGEIVFDHMSLAYGNTSGGGGEESNPVLDDICVRIEAGESVGIVGRTGAGKSSLIAALFRLTEPSGRILIDGVNVGEIGLDELRRRLSIIPQDPVVFSGTVRYNLDPFREYPDAELWRVLDAVQLRSTVTAMVGGLEARLADGGANLSVGQRQLVCLARALLRRNRILIADEATANVDHQTDALIQRTIRTEFGGCTVLTVAHRLNTVIDADKVMVLDAGRVVEFDAPHRLLQSEEESVFASMCRTTGPSMFDHLRREAEKAYRRMRRRKRVGSSSRSASLASIGLLEEEEEEEEDEKEVNKPEVTQF